MTGFTAFGSIDFEEHIALVLAELKEKILAADKHNCIKSIVLGGGYGRGEGGVLIVDGKERLYNDLDLFLFYDQANPLSLHKLSASLKEIALSMQEKHQIHFDLSKPVKLSSLSSMPITLMYYDLLKGHKVLFGNEKTLFALPNWQAKDLPLQEAIRLVMNRSVGLFLASQKMNSNQVNQEQCDFINRNIHKANQALLDAILIAEGSYVSSFEDKLSALERLSLIKYDIESINTQDIKDSMQFKQKPVYIDYDPKACNKRLMHSTIAMNKLYYKLWSLLLKENICDYDSFLTALNKSEDTHFTPTYKNIILNTLTSGRRSLPYKDYSSYPRLRLYKTLPFFVFGELSSKIKLAQILGLEDNALRSKMDKQFLKLWQRFN